MEPDLIEARLELGWIQQLSRRSPLHFWLFHLYTAYWPDFRQRLLTVLYGGISL